MILNIKLHIFQGVHLVTNEVYHCVYHKKGPMEIICGIFVDVEFYVYLKNNT